MQESRVEHTDAVCVFVMPPQCFGSPGLRHRGLGGWSKKRKPREFVFDFENEVSLLYLKLVLFYESELLLLQIETR